MVEVLRTYQYGGVIYHPGAVVDVPESEGEFVGSILRLVSGGDAEPPAPAEAPPKAPRRGGRRGGA